MAPAATDGIPSVAELSVKDNTKPAPLKLSGALDGFEQDDVTPVIGREFINVNIVDDILNSPYADERLRDVAITISQRGVVFFRKQDNLTDALQKEFVHRMGLLVGKPKDSTLHVHPTLNNTNEFGNDDAEISVISSASRKKYRSFAPPGVPRKYDAAQWHSDIQFENFPADYTSLRLTTLPSTGGDTLWASGYEIYDRFSKPYQKFFDSLTATYSGEGFLKLVAAGKAKLYEQPRGSPHNVGDYLTAVHPVVRTNPVTGWKSIFAIGPFPVAINELSKEESDGILSMLRQAIIDQHDLQVRFRWKNPNDIAIWDNRSVFHSATFDYDNIGERFGNRAVGIGERPYFDPESRSRREFLKENGLAF
ncbi:putative taurine dioxygenase family protein [Coleophoma crateriformis]|uniref:Putative taurine dioxygenase family protein n=1 Tax=Coleophoma crateriformis TaxID=565419 RepID=A0A3D8QIV9_9HELO|nr:putative taurine dioxygenase family protein [Coleophoma crateriformis]